ncbi:MAG: carbon-nitrogen family hydrolase [bacterium]|jgi:omega-amidase|nr:carbon-nitrogen family hydrolase [Bacillota bacterium]HHW54999.1 carbon-nitrogen family hydrolase [Bacillota bacterium]
MKLKIGLAQMDTVLGRGEENRRRFQELLEELAGEADLVLFPETWNLGFYPQKVSQLAEGEGETTKSFVAGLARRHRVNICAGSIAEGEDGKLYNTSYVFDRQGELIGCYRKIHLFTHGKEHHHFSAGSRPGLFTAEGITWGQLICYDIRFPELARTLALAGAQVLLIPAQWPYARLHHWRTLLMARAIENQLYVIGVNSCGTMVGGRKACGHSLAVDPWGEIMAEAGEGEETLLVELDLARVEEVRREFGVFTDRRPQLYALEEDTFL